MLNSFRSRSSSSHSSKESSQSPSPHRHRIGSKSPSSAPVASSPGNNDKEELKPADAIVEVVDT